ncbi:DUF421 domain-containing protein [Bacillus cereus]|nr:DUF421 domain-containing protein [Bacillus cereus]
MPHVSDWLLVIIRSFVLLIILFSMTKLLGKRQISQLSFFEYVAGLTIGNITAEVATGLERNFWHGISSMLVFSLVPFFAGMIALKNKRLRNFIEGKATIFIKDGKVLEDNLKKENYTIDELLELLRKKDVFNITDVEYAVLESGGELNVLLKRDKQPLTPKDIGLQIAPAKETQTVIMDGNVLDEPLSASGHNRAWLHAELEKIGVVIENVFIGQVDSYGQLTVDIYNDQIQMPSPQDKPLLLASLKKCQADLELFSLETKSNSASQMYSKNAKQVEHILNRVTYLLKE